MKNEYEYKIEDTVVAVYKNAVRAYEITRDGCSCVGFGFNKKCRHHDYAEINGLLKELESKKTDTYFMKENVYFTDLRIKTIEAYCLAKGLTWAKNKIAKMGEMMPKFVAEGKTLRDLEIVVDKLLHIGYIVDTRTTA